MWGMILKQLAFVALLVAYPNAILSQSSAPPKYCPLDRYALMHLCTANPIYTTATKIDLLNRHLLKSDVATDRSFKAYIEQELKPLCGGEQGFLEAVRSLKRQTARVPADCIPMPELPEPPDPLAISTFTAIPETVNEGAPTKLVWETKGAKRVSLNGEAVQLAGQKELSAMKESTDFTLQAFDGEDKEVKAKLRVSVTRIEIPKGPPLSFQEVVLLFESKLPTARIEKLIQARKINFDITKPYGEALKQLGATATMIGEMALNRN